MSVSPKRKAALQWFHDNNGATLLPLDGTGPSGEMARKMRRDGELTTESNGDMCLDSWVLTDLGRRRLNGDNV